jgi:hypothetical protein
MITFNAITGGILSGIAGVGLLAGFGFGDLISTEERSMSLIDLRYEDGYFIQSHQVNSGPIKGYWSAEIMRDGQQLCSGGGEAPYETGVKQFNANDWTGDDCPELLTGDIARAVWEYRLNNGGIAAISGEIVIK